MKKICFVCLGNICRSPMAEYIMKKKVQERGLENDFLITSRATSYEEIGNDIYPPAKEKLLAESIPFGNHFATHLQKSDYDKYEYFICMDKNNVLNTNQIFNTSSSDKVFRLLDKTPLKKDIADPWYTKDFTTTYKDLDYGIDIILDLLTK